MDIKKIFELYAVRDDGRRFDYNNLDWAVISNGLKGFDFSEIETFKSARGMGDGDVITGQRRKSRAIEITARPCGRVPMETLRNRALSFHNTKHKYNIFINYLGVKRIAKDCVITARALPTGNVYKKANLTIAFLSPYADLFSNETVKEEMIERSARWKVTRAYLPGKKLLFATETQAKDKVIYYEGTNPAPIIMELVATGYCSKFHFKVGEKEAGINISMSGGDRLKIDSEQAFATLNEKIIPFNKCGNFDMRQFRILNGDNLVTIYAEQGDAFKTQISYRGRYDGV